MRKLAGSATPAKFTVLLCLMRPRRRDGSVRDGPSTSTSMVRPTKRWARSVACRWTDSTSRSMRSPFTSCGTWAARVAASVPRRGENMKVKAESKRTASTTSSVSSKSSSVSPGKPTMMSVLSAQSGARSRIIATRSR